MTYIMIPIDPVLLHVIDEAADLMEISRDDLVQKILKLWEKNHTLPLHGTDHFCHMNHPRSDQTRQS
jgi:hypothetical protein